MADLSINTAVKLPSGFEMPQLGFGVYQTPPEEAERCCNEALKAGYRHIDSAAVYRNEAGCGRAIRAQARREDIFFTSKILPGADYEQAKKLVQETLTKSGLGYIDLMLIHSPHGGPAARKGIWKALVEAVEAGDVRSIGVSNYGVHHLDELESYIAELEVERGGKGRGGILSVGQYEIHPWLTRNDIVEWCRKRGVVVQAYCPLTRAQRFEEPALKALAKKYGKSEAQVLVRWSLQKGFVPLPKSVTNARIVENANVYDFALTPDEVAGLQTDEYSPVSWDPTVFALDK